MTVTDAINSDKMFLTPAEASEIIGSNPQTIRVAAHQKPELLGFPVVVLGSRVKIPRIPFLRALGY